MYIYKFYKLRNALNTFLMHFSLMKSAKINFVEASSLGIVQASLTLPSLNACFQDCGCFAFSLYFFLDKKVPKNQDSACLAQKTSVRLAESFKLAAAQLKQERFFTPISLVFWLTRRGRSARKTLNTKHFLTL
jgi:hypothetical protein